ncbi:MAG: putative manganese-dependent inorganic diphosphatase [Clostridia bacterium]|nr:putative manganese-dependent inorganic diphosphatase [Clostridia bacterium]
MDTTFVCGHRNPDTDSIVSAIAYARLRNALGDNGYVAARAGHLNDESSFLLKRFGFEAPVYLPTVRTQIRDIDFDRPPLLNKQVPVHHAWEILQESDGLSAIPVTNADGTLFGVLTAGGIAESDMASIQHPAVKDVPVVNLLAALEGRIINDEDDTFETLSGEVVIALPRKGDVLRGVKAGSIVLCGEQPETAEAALELGVSCLILCEGALAERYRGRHSDTCILVTPCDAYRAARMIYQAIPVSRIAHQDELVCFHLDDFLDDVRDSVLQSRFRSYPVLDAQERVVGTLSRYHLLRPKRKRLVLVDHNEVGQAVQGLEQAELIAIIDHHRLGDVETGYPVFMRNEPVGSTATIIATMFQEHGLQPEEKLAGLLCAAILSDTVMFKSPTATALDRRIAERLAHIAGLETEALGREVFSASQSADKSADALIRTDLKEFHMGDHRVCISQITTMDSSAMLTREEEFRAVMRGIKRDRGYDLVLLMITDVLREGTALLYVGDEEIIRQAFGGSRPEDGRVFLEGVVSRKKQVVPALAILWG